MPANHPIHHWHSHTITKKVVARNIWIRRRHHHIYDKEKKFISSLKMHGTYEIVIFLFTQPFQGHRMALCVILYIFLFFRFDFFLFCFFIRLHYCLFICGFVLFVCVWYFFVLFKFIFETPLTFVRLFLPVKYSFLWFGFDTCRPLDYVIVCLRMEINKMEQCASKSHAPNTPNMG